jgi:hypothetical protein
MNAAAAEMQAQLDSNPCIRREGDVISSVPYRECVDLLPAERMHGVWYVEMEGSGFLPDATTAPEQRFQATDTKLPENETWLDVDRAAAEAAWRQAGALPEGHGTLAMAIDFIGRRARNEGHYGHGDARKLIVVDRIISLRPIRWVRTWMEFPICVDTCGWRR